MLNIVRTDPRLVEVTMAVRIDKPTVALIGVDGGEVVGVGGLGWGAGRCWIWFHMKQSRPSYAGKIIREARRLLKLAVQLGETAVYVYRDPRYSTSEKLVRFMGFEPAGHEVAGDGQEYEVWLWRHYR